MPSTRLYPTPALRSLPTVSPSRPAIQWARWLALVDVAQAAALATALVVCARTLVSPAPFEYAESDTATWIWMLRHGQPIYGPLAGLPTRLSHYPPLQLWLVARLAPSDGAILTVARALSLFGLALTALAARLCVARATGSARAGRSAALLVITTAPIVFFGASGRSDLLALGLAALAMTLVALRVRGWPLLAAVLFALAVLCKHNVIILALGALWWASWRRPRQALVLGAVLAGCVGAVVLRLHLLVPLVAWMPTSWRLGSFLAPALSDVLPQAAALVIIAGLWRARRRIPAEAAAVLEPWLAAAALGCLWLPALARVGASTNYLLEWLLALAITSSIAAQLGIAARWQRLHAAATSVRTLAKLWPLLFVVIPRVEAEQRAARQALASAGTGDRVLAERAWLATAAGQPPLVIPFLSHQLALRHLWNEGPLVELAEHRQLTEVLLDFALDEAVPAQRHLDRFSPELLDALRRGYVLSSQVGELHVYRPRRD
jgi:hypothetical protein